MATAPAPTARRDRLVVAASSLGTVFEWYDFYLYGLLATIISSQFFSGVNETTGFIFALAAFAAGFAVRPFGALVFGRIGDLVGRKYTFLVTMAIMGLSTFLVGLLPSFASIGVAAPVMLDRKSTRLNSSHANISYAVFCLKKKKTNLYAHYRTNLTPTNN